MADDAASTQAAPDAVVQLKSPYQRRQDVFDAPDFDPVKFINQIYPDEASLGDLDRFTEVLRKQIKSVDKEIFAAVRSQSNTQTRSRQDLSVATSQMAELFARVQDIQRKAGDSEVLVQEICRDIRKLDYAKKHLTHTITSLRRLAMLTAAVDDLEQVGHRRDQYKRCANLLEAVSQLLEHFSHYHDVPKIAGLHRRLAVVQASLQDAVLDDFKLLLGPSDVQLSPDNAERLSAACLVVNALGPKVRDQLMDWLCEREMAVYQTIFSMSGDAAKLDRFERRFAWFKGRMEERKEVWGLFPPAWRVPQVLCLTFCKITKAAVSRLLSDSEDVVAQDVGPLLKAVVATNKFEREMAALFGGRGAHADGDEEEPGGAQDADNLPASEARRRLEAFRKKQQAAKQQHQQQQAGAAAAAAAAAAGAGAAGGTSAGGRGEADAAAADAAARVAFEGSISGAFEGALRHYVAEEQKELLRHLEHLVREEGERGWRPPEGQEGSAVLGSANQLFLKIRGSTQRCVKLVSRGNTLLRLAGAFKHVLSQYAGELLRRLPKTAAGGTAAQPPYSGTDWHVRLPEEEEAVLCSILATAEYCRETTEGLTRMIARELQPPQLADRLDLSEEESAFTGVASQCLSVLVLGINTHLDACLQDMLRVRWDAIESPGDDLPYVTALRQKLLGEVAPRLGAALDRTQFDFFCDKLGRMFVPRFLDTIYKLRKVSDKGTIQLSIDVDSVRRLLLEFPRAARPLDAAEGGGGSSSSSSSSSSYAHHVEQQMGAAISLVKVLQAKPENLVDTFILLMPPAANTAHELGRVCELKGFTKKLQGELLLQYQRKVGGGSAATAATTADYAQQQQQPQHGGGGGGLSASFLLPSLGSGSATTSPAKPLGQQQQQQQQQGLPGSGGSSGQAGVPPPGPGAAGSASSSSAFAAAGFGGGSGSGSGGVQQGGGGSGSGAAASNLSALKMSVNSFTRELASSMSTIGRGGADAPGGSPQARSEKSTLFKPGGLHFNMQQTAARTREGLAKISLPFKLGGGGGGGGNSCDAQQQ